MEQIPRSTITVELGTPDAPVLVRWSSLSRSGSFRESYALRTDDGVIYVDPEAVAPDAAPSVVRTLTGVGSPVAVVLTSSFHERAAYVVRERFGAPVWMPRALSEFRDGEPDHFFDEQTRLPGGLGAIDIDETGMSNLVLWWRAPDHATGGRVLFTGDLVLGQAHPEERNAVAWRAGPGLYCWMYSDLERERLRARYRRLVAEGYDLLCPGHGLPVHGTPTALLTRLLEGGTLTRGSGGTRLAL